MARDRPSRTATPRPGLPLVNRWLCLRCSKARSCLGLRHAVSRRIDPVGCSRRSRSHHSGSTGRWTSGWPPQATAARDADSADMNESALGHHARLRLPRPHGAARDSDAPCPGRHGEAAVALHADTDLRGRPVVDQFHLAPAEGTGGEHLTQIRKSVTHGPRQRAKARPLLDSAGVGHRASLGTRRHPRRNDR